MHGPVWPFLLFLSSLVLAGIGALASRSKHANVPIASSVYAFMLANTAFMIGVAKALSGKRIVAYSAGSGKERIGSLGERE